MVFTIPDMNYIINTIEDVLYLDSLFDLYIGFQNTDGEGGKGRYVIVIYM
jgi:hypothetical protein